MTAPAAPPAPPSATRAARWLGPYARLIPYVRPHLGALVAGGLLAVVVAAMEGAVAWLVKPAMDEIFIRRDLLMLKLLPFALVGAYLVKGGAHYLQAYLMTAVGDRVVTRLRSEVYAHLQAMSLAFFAETHSGELMARILSDVQRLARLSSTILVMVVRHVATIIALLIVMFTHEWFLSLLAVVTFPAVAQVVRVIGRKLYRINKRAQARMGQLAILLHESFGGARIIKAFGGESHERQRFEVINQRLLALSLKNARTDELTEPVMELAGAVGIVFTLVYGGYRVIEGQMTPGTFFSFTAAVIMLYGPVRRLSRMMNTIQQSAGAVERVFDVLDRRPAVADRPGAMTLAGFHEAIRYEHVDFRYPGVLDLALRDVTVTIARGEIVAFVGMSGAGKSTMLDLLPRFHDVTGGRITIDGQDLRDLTQASLRAIIGLVTQETFLFNESIAYNIGYGRPGASTEDIVQAARRAQAHDFVMACPQGYQSVVGERGVRLSGGQRQRIAIARAFLKNPPILVLDEATSDLDAESEFLVQQALAELIQGRTVLVIAHRLATVRRADRIVVIHQGHVVDIGTHDVLLQRDGVYRRLYALQTENVSWP